MRGMGELHLDILVDRLKREFKVEANIGAPQVAYRETITKQVEVDYTHKNSLAVLASLPVLSWSFHPCPKAAMVLPTQLLVVLFQKNSFLELKKALCRQKKQVLLRAFR